MGATDGHRLALAERKAQIAYPQDTEWRTSSLGRTGAFLAGLAQAPEDLKVSI